MTSLSCNIKINKINTKNKNIFHHYYLYEQNLGNRGIIVILNYYYVFTLNYERFKFVVYTY